MFSEKEFSQSDPNTFVTTLEFKDPVCSLLRSFQHLQCFKAKVQGETEDISMPGMLQNYGRKSQAEGQIPVITAILEAEVGGSHVDGGQPGQVRQTLSLNQMRRTEV